MPRNVILFQDGAIDELMSVALLTAMPRSKVRYLGCFVVNGDCLAWPTVQVQKKILAYMSELNPALPTDTFVLPVNCRAVNAFPWTYRQYSMMANLLPALNAGSAKAQGSKQPAHPAERRTQAARLVLDLAEKAGTKLTLLSLGPLTPIADLLALLGPRLHDVVEEVVWMGGALPPVAGNIDTGIAIGANPSAEWNAYWDPYAVDSVFRSGLPLRLFPLNVTNDYALDSKFFEQYIYPNKSYPMIDLAGQMYSTVAFETGYCFWDTVTTAYLGKPDLFSFENHRLVINTDFTSPDFGSIKKSRRGSRIQVAKKAKSVEAFYRYLVARLESVAKG